MFTNTCMAHSPQVLVDSSVIISALNSPTGAPAHILELGRIKTLTLVIIPYIVAEVEDVLKRKFPLLASRWKNVQQEKIFHILSNPTVDELKQAASLTTDPNDVPIIAAGFVHRVDFLVTLDRKHFLNSQKLLQNKKFKTLHASELIERYKRD